VTTRARSARPDDHEAFTRFWAQLITDNPAPPREEWVEHLCPNALFIEEHGALVAYALAFPFGARGDVRQIVVDQAARGRGLGKVVMAAVADKLRAAGCTEWRLETHATNAAALALYRSVGMRAHRTINCVRMAREPRAAFAATRSKRHAVVVVAPEDDRELESNLDLGAGQLARWRRARGTSPLVRVGMHALTQLWRDFSPTLGLLFPFYAQEPDIAAHFLAEADAERAIEEYEIVTVEPGVYAALVAAGARDHEQLLELAGELSR
jgi:ribosomal protein S18 acetylase RimI-like enzyme